MATRPPSDQDPRTRVRSRDTLWSAAVGSARASEPGIDPYPPSYEFSNGRRFVERIPAHARDDDGNPLP